MTEQGDFVPKQEIRWGRERIIERILATINTETLEKCERHIMAYLETLQKDIADRKLNKVETK